jgi:hypothetical protein
MQALVSFIFLEGYNHLISRRCFWINLPLGGLAIATSILLIPFKPIPGGIRDKLVKIDYTGSGLTILSSVLLIVILSVAFGGCVADLFRAVGFELGWGDIWVGFRTCHCLISSRHCDPRWLHNMGMAGCQIANCAWLVAVSYPISSSIFWIYWTVHIFANPTVLGVYIATLMKYVNFLSSSAS